MHADRVAVVRRGALRLLRAQSDRATPIAMKEVVNRLASLALDLVNPSPAKRSQQFAVEGEAPVERTDDEVQVVDPRHDLLVPRANRSISTLVRFAVSSRTVDGLAYAGPSLGTSTSSCAHAVAFERPYR